MIDRMHESKNMSYENLQYIMYERLNSGKWK